MSVRDRSGEARDDVVVAALQRLAPHLDGEPDPAFRAAHHRIPPAPGSPRR
jgi:hypothetical protein